MPPSYPIGLLPPALSSARLLRIFLARIILLLPIVIFNFYLFRWYEPHAGGLPAVLQFIIPAFWFCCNFWFLRSMQAGINRFSIGHGFIWNRPKFG